ncbi:MAG: hypothetical protein U0414_18195 [Polyangiaceae bacterium]
MTIGDGSHQLTGTGVHSPSPAIFGPPGAGDPRSGGNHGGTSGALALDEAAGATSAAEALAAMRGAIVLAEGGAGEPSEHAIP